jgi:hypothetical protein
VLPKEPLQKDTSGPGMGLFAAWCYEHRFHLPDFRVIGAIESVGGGRYVKVESPGGLVSPASGWGPMMSENQAMIGLNPMAVLALAVILALLTVSMNLIADAYMRAISD